jgi:sigma-B regulation protein RsbQ
MNRSVLARNHVTRMGQGKPVVVLAHGFGCDQRAWRYVAPGLAQDKQVVLFDHVGCGSSDLAAWRPDRYASLDDYARDVIELIHALDTGPVAYVGHSISSSIGLLAANHRPDLFQSLVMVAPNPCFINEPPHYEGGFERSDLLDLLDLMDRNMVGWADFFAPVAMKNPDRPELSEELRASLCAGDPGIVRHFAQLVFMSDVRASLPAVQVPTLILQCDDDTVAPLSVGDYLHRHMPTSRLHRLQATGHCPHMSHPGEVISALRTYLQPLSR